MSTEDTLPFVTQRLSTNWLKATIRDKSPSMMICPSDKASESCHKPQVLPRQEEQKWGLKGL
jgi:hypothetical protein